MNKNNEKHDTVKNNLIKQNNYPKQDRWKQNLHLATL